MRISSATRVLHFGMIITVLYQLLSSLIMVAPEPGKMVGFQTILFSLHILFFGWGAFLISAVYSMMLFQDRDRWERLIPWFSAERRAALFNSAGKEIPDMFRGHLAPPEENGVVAGAVHGLGVLLLIALGLTGAYVMLGVRSDGTMRTDTLLLLDFHEFFAVLIWIFLAGHIAMAIYHLILGRRRILDIFQRVKIPWN
jgi:cytochrome b561